jgi:hypothetical protein
LNLSAYENHEGHAAATITPQHIHSPPMFVAGCGGAATSKNPRWRMGLSPNAHFWCSEDAMMSASVLRCMWTPHAFSVAYDATVGCCDNESWLGG